MIIVEWWKTVVLQRYAKFDGRAGRAEFWWFYLADLILFFALAVLSQISSFLVILLFLFAIAMIVPNIAVAIRRLHDTNKSGWFLLIGLVPFIGGIVLLVFYIMQGDANSNNFGPPDSGVPATAAA